MDLAYRMNDHHPDLFDEFRKDCFDDDPEEDSKVTEKELAKDGNYKRPREDSPLLHVSKKANRDKEIQDGDILNY